MKKIILSLFVFVAANISMAQSTKYVTAMRSALQKMENVKTMEQAEAEAATFERIANVEKSEWLPYYYAGVAFIQPVFGQKDIDKDKAADAMDHYADMANERHPSSENYVIKYLAAVSHLLANPMARFAEYGPKMQSIYEQGIAMDSLNPRLYYVKGSVVMNTPSFAGGGPKAAKPYFEKAKSLFDQQTDTTTLQPHWGKELNAALLEKCN